MSAEGGTRRLVLDPGARRLDGGRVLLGGSPLRLLRLTAAGAQVVDRIEAGRPVGASRLVDRLLDTGAAHPVALTRRIFEDSAREVFPQVTGVVPVFRHGPGGGPGGGPAGGPGGGSVDELVVRFGAVGVDQVVVVDDGSPIPLAPPAGSAGVRLLRHDSNRGPGAARNTALAAVTTPLVAFVDADVDLPDTDWLTPLLAHFDDPAVVAVAPRIAGRPGPGRLARYEARHSPLDLGPTPGPVQARTRVGYVPTALLVARVDALRAIGGFDPTMRTGEDVDLVWRLTEAGGRVRYEPGVVVHHRPRADLAGFVRQRAGYGRSAAPLSRRHRGALAPVGVSAWSAAAWAVGAMASPLAGVAIAAASTAALPRKLRGSLRHPVVEALRLAGKGHLFAGRQLAEGVTRAWWPLALAAALLSRRARRAALAAAFLPPIIDWVRRRPPLDAPSYVGLRLLDHAAYGAGLWQGMASERTLAPIVPDLSSWPGRSNGRSNDQTSASPRAADA